MEKYIKLGKIGEGTYATVYRARNTLTNELVALKEITLSPHEGTPSTALREIAFMKELRHPNVVRLLEVIHSEVQLVLVFECMYQDLKQFLDKHRKMSMPLDLYTIKSLLRQLLEGTFYCHQERILHRDLKPHNLLLDRHGKVLKMADFGLARAYGIPVAAFSSEVVTLWYRPPDVLLGSNNYSTHIDIWSVGCIMAELYTVGYPLFPGKDVRDQVKRIFQVLGSPTRDEWSYIISPSRHPPSWLREMDVYPPQDLHSLLPSMDEDAVDLLKRMLDYRPEFRITAADALTHPYFAADHRDQTSLSQMLLEETSSSSKKDGGSEACSTKDDGYNGSLGVEFTTAASSRPF